MKSTDKTNNADNERCVTPEVKKSFDDIRARCVDCMRTRTEALERKCRYYLSKREYDEDDPPRPNY